MIHYASSLSNDETMMGLLSMPQQRRYCGRATMRQWDIKFPEQPQIADDVFDDTFFSDGMIGNFFPRNAMTAIDNRIKPCWCLLLMFLWANEKSRRHGGWVCRCRWDVGKDKWWKGIQSKICPWNWNNIKGEVVVLFRSLRAPTIRGGVRWNDVSDGDRVMLWIVVDV